MFKTLKISSLIFLTTNFFFFLSILLTYFDLGKFTASHNPMFSDFSVTTYISAMIFLASLNFNLIFCLKNKNLLFSIYFYFLVLSSGFFFLNVPIFDELILFSTSCLFLILLLFSSKKIFLNIKNKIILLLFFVLLLQSILGLIYDIKSIRYIVLFTCLIISFIFFNNYDFEDKTKKIIFIKMIFYAVIIYFFSQFFFWILKYYFFDLKSTSDLFIGNMQPSNVNSAAGHLEAPGILAGYLFLYYSITSKDVFKRILLFSLLILTWKLADSRAALYLAIACFFFYWLLTSFKKKIIIIACLILLYFSSSLFNKQIKIMSRIFINVLDFKTGEIYLSGNTNKYSYVARYGDFNRWAYVFSPIYSIKDLNFSILYGCGFYGYYFCQETNLINYYEINNVTYRKKEGYLSSQIRPPALGTILAENGILLILGFLLIYLKFILINFFLNNNKIILSLYFISVFLIWSFFANLFDIIYFYYFLTPFFYKKIFPDT